MRHLRTASLSRVATSGSAILFDLKGCKMNNKKNIFGFQKREKPDLEREDKTPNLAYYFKLLWRNAGKLLTLNLIMDFMFFPLVAILIIYLFGRQTTTIPSAAFSPLLGVRILGEQCENLPGIGSTATSAMLGLFGELQDAAFPTTPAIVIMIVLALFTIITWGWQNVGAAYNLRSLVRGDSCFLLSDYFYAIKRNWKQGLIFGLIDITVIGVLLFDLYYYGSSLLDPTIAENGAFLYYAVLFLSVALAVIYVFMRFYIYTMMITFDLSIKKLLKNALIFSMLGIKRNFLAFVAISTVALANVLIVMPALSIGFTLPIILPFFYLPAFGGFVSMYAAYPNIRRYMIDGRTELSTYGEEAEDYEDEETELTPPPQEAD